jgi:hypothetical protein
MIRHMYKTPAVGVVLLYLQGGFLGGISNYCCTSPPNLTVQAFTDSCDQHNLRTNMLGFRNCSDMCISMRIEDKIGGKLGCL